MVKGYRIKLKGWLEQSSASNFQLKGGCMVTRPQNGWDAYKGRNGDKRRNGHKRKT